ncbi:hypothetical protein MSUIS_05200 [Mycoplasma suis KI3806]|uniref:Uncharacterized protein n=1 Tax=Mycoplasma suis (strain KI_3806) TaxID=708248 RepID=F0V1T2_MYCS3|nr:hypothetical protein [Mycoplasma suis]CBZ40613.1 hypothetical protein MSUIS_05200 [Mycoplasma suis KI3806]
MLIGGKKALYLLALLIPAGATIPFMTGNLDLNNLSSGNSLSGNKNSLIGSLNYGNTLSNLHINNSLIDGTEVSSIKIPSQTTHNSSSLEINVQEDSLGISINFQESLLNNVFSSSDFSGLGEISGKDYIENIQKEISKKGQTEEIQVEMVQQKEKTDKDLESYKTNFQTSLEKVKKSARKMHAVWSSNKSKSQSRNVPKTSLSSVIENFNKEERKSVQEFYKSYCDSISKKEDLTGKLQVVEGQGTRSYLEESSSCKKILEALTGMGWPEDDMTFSNLLLGPKVETIFKSMSDQLKMKEELLKEGSINRVCALFIPSAKKCLTDEEVLVRDKKNLLKALVLKVMIKLLQDMDRMQKTNSGTPKN